MLLKPCAPGTSFFRLIDEYWHRSSSSHVFNRICTIMRRMGACSMLIEEVTEKDSEFPRLRKEMRAIQKRLARKLPTTITKFTFIRTRHCDVDTNSINQIPEDHFLGYLILVDLKLPIGKPWSYVFEAIVREAAYLSADSNKLVAYPQHYLHVKRRFRCSVGNARDYHIVGSYFRQQNGITNVCAHACTIMMLNNCFDRSDIVSAEDVNDILRLDQTHRKLALSCPNNEKCDLPFGLALEQMETALRYYALTPKKLEFHGTTSQKTFRAFLYGFVESGYPAMLSFSAHEGTEQEVGHVVSVVGHTLNLDSWLPTALALNGPKTSGSEFDYTTSLSWVDDFIVHDDNLGMQFRIPAHSFKPKSNPDSDANFTPLAGMGVFPSRLNVRLLGHSACDVAFDALRLMVAKTAGDILGCNYYSRRLLCQKTTSLSRRPVFRSLLVSADDYRKSLIASQFLSEPSAQQLSELFARVPHFWLVEVTEPDLLLGNSSKVLDILIDPTLSISSSDTESVDDFGVIAIRLPETLMFKLDERWFEIPADDKNLGHLPMFTHSTVRTVTDT